MVPVAITQINIKKVNANCVTDASDILAAEEPLEIKLEYGPNDGRVRKSLSITMRTPGNDAELATGFLFTEGIITRLNDINAVTTLLENTVQVSLAEDISLDMTKLERHFYTTSSCGVCGKSSIDAVRTVCKIPVSDDELHFPASLIYKLPDMLRRQQDVFESTGGLHASALFDTSAELLLVREDVGRHNALDKLVGAALEKGLLPLDKYLLLLSGRASFELVQKAAMAGIRLVAAVGAPSSLAVELAEESGITLIGFLRGERFNIYSNAERIDI